MTNRKVLAAGIREDATNYIAALKGIDCEPVVALELPTGEGMELSDFAGLLLPGGSDIDPALFGQENRGSRTIHRDLDEKQLALARLFAEAGKPILGICKGCQVINVCFGGTLLQDLPNNVYHQWDREREEDEHHGAIATGDNWISQLYGTGLVTITRHWTDWERDWWSARKVTMVSLRQSAMKRSPFSLPSGIRNG